MTVELQNKILDFIQKRSKSFPVTIKELEGKLGCKNGLIHRHISKLVAKGLVETKQVAKPKGGETYYKTTEQLWPECLEKKCFDCHNKSRIATCTFYEELAEKGIIIRPDRLNIKLTKNTFACDKLIERKTNWYRQKLEDFLDENRWVTKSDHGLEISYHCANENCQALLPQLGSGFIAKLGSSVIRCNECNSFYKTLFDEKKESFIVNYNKEKGLEYKQNFAELTNGDEPEQLYSSDKYGIVIHDLRDCNFNFRTKTLVVNNWIGKLEEINYLVVKRSEDFNQVVELLEQKGYEKIEIILGADKLISPPPVLQQVGILRLLRVIMIINKEFCFAMLRSRITVIEKVHELFDRKNYFLVKRAIKIIEEIITEVGEKPYITPKEWNAFEMKAGKVMWEVVGAYLMELRIDFPGRGRSRLVEDISMPYRRFYAYSQIDALINGVYGIAGEFVKKYCLEIEFCWDGLPGLCHEKTRGGIFGFHLDMREPEKIVTIPYLLKAIKEGGIDPKNVLYYRGRNRQKIFFIKQETELEEQIIEVIEEMLKSKINGKRGSYTIQEYYMQGKQWLRDLHRISNYYEIKHHGVEYQPWVIMKEKIWEMIGREEKEGLIDYLRIEHGKVGFKPLTVVEMN